MPVASRSHRKPSARPRPVAFHVLLYPERDRMLAHVLETDTVSDGETPDAALRGVEEALQIEFEHDARQPHEAAASASSAPTPFWSALKSARLTDTRKLRLPTVGEATLLAYRLDEAPRA